MDNIRPRTSSFSPSTRFSTTRTLHRPQRPKKIMKSYTGLRKASTVGHTAVLPQNVNVKGSVMGNPEEDLKDYAIIDSGCSGSMTGDKDKLSDFKEFKGGYVAFGNDSKGGRKENQKGKGPDWMFDLELLTPSMNYIPVRKENYVDSGGNVSTHDDVDDLDVQQFIVHGPSIHAAQPMHSEESTADKEVPLFSDEQALHDELVSLMHQESLAKLHNDAQRTAFEKEKKRITLEKEKECVDSTFTLSTANTPPQSTGNTPTNSDDDIPKDGVFSTNSFDDEHTDTEEDRPPDYSNMDHTIDVSSTPTHIIHKIHPQKEPKKITQALQDESWVEAMQEELLQFKL
ncbi:hypothetical protein Tco_1022593 [Tanacetum coccineum]